MTNTLKPIHINADTLKLKYVEESFKGKPSFLIRANGKEYISNGCVFVENTKENVQQLVEKYNCQNYLDELFKAEWGDMLNVTTAQFMFKGCKNLTSFTGDMSSVTDALYMFYGCESLTSFTGDMSSVTDAWFMFDGCENLTTFTGDMSSVPDAWSMFDGCDKLEREDLAHG